MINIKVRFIRILLLLLYEKYTYEQVCQLLEWPQNEVPLNIGGYKFHKETKTYPVFINYHKADDIQDTIKYEDRFENPGLLKAISKKINDHFLLMMCRLHLTLMP